jgi:glycosyltransferase involved in cell wall biosynthesis
MKVFIANPELQHAHEFAQALYENEYLQQFWTGVPLTSKTVPRKAWLFRFPRLVTTPIPKVLRRSLPVFPFLRKLSIRILRPYAANWCVHRLQNIFDLRMSCKITELKPEIVICYENAALHSFRAAKKIGAVCILDAASIHYNAQTEALGLEADLDPVWIKRRKKEEIDLADVILTCSEWARETYIANRVAPSKLLTCQLGAELPSLNSRKLQDRSEGMRFIFVGSIRRLKGVDVLLAIFEEFHHEGVRASLTLVGGIGDRDLVKQIKAVPNSRLVAFLRKPELFEFITRHDCLVLPSRLDGFGMVVPEAMAMGLPAIVSENVGAKMIIERHPEAGWIVPFEKQALKNCMLDLINQPDRLATASDSARNAAKKFTWQAYRKRVVGIVEEIYANKRVDQSCATLRSERAVSA